MSMTSFVLIALATLPALGLALWASMAMARIDRDLVEFTGFDDIRFKA